MKKILLVGLSILLLSGCSGGSSIDGTYICTTVKTPNDTIRKEIDQTFEIKGDKFTVVEKLRTHRDSISVLEYEGTITKIDGNKYKLKYTPDDYQKEATITKGEMIFTRSNAKYLPNTDCRLQK